MSCIKTKIFFKAEEREDNSKNLPIGQYEFRYELTFWFISIENIGQKSKKTMRVEITQFVMVNLIP